MTEQSDTPRAVSLLVTLRSILAVLLGIVAIVLLSYGTNKLIRSFDFFPYGNPAVAIVYRSVYVVLGSYIVAKFAPSNPMRHALVLGVVMFVLIAVSAITLIPMQFFGPTWYYIWLLITTVPCAWFGGILHRRFHRQALTNVT